MCKVTFLLENWYLVVALMAVTGMVGVFIGRFLKMPTAEQREKVKEWLLWAVTQAEAELGSGTGKLKLRQTYDSCRDSLRLLWRYPSIPSLRGWMKHWKKCEKC